MLPWTLVDTAPIPDDGGELRLYQRGAEYSIRVDSYELMNSRVHGSEDALAALTCERLPDRSRARVLIGGLGMGFTLAAVLRGLGAGSRIVVAELVPAVVRWNRGALAPSDGALLDDPRVTVREVDVARVIAEVPNAYDAILLDVDNGPVGLTSKSNDRLYTAAGLRAAHAALRAHGVLAVWSAGPDATFTRRVQRAGFDVEEVVVRGRGKAGGSRFVIWLARRL